jgi:hypothetical protein
MSRTRGRVAGLLTALTLVLAPVLALGSAAPAQAATGTTYVSICTVKPSGTATPTIASFWWNGSAWTQQSSVRAGCATFTLGHSGYWYFRASTYALLPCVEYVYGWTSNTVIKQNLPTSTSVNVNLAYERSVPLYC